MIRHRTASLGTLLYVTCACSGAVTSSAATGGGAGAPGNSPSDASTAVRVPEGSAGSPADGSTDVATDVLADAPNDAQKACAPPAPIGPQTPELVTTLVAAAGWPKALGFYGHSALGTVWTQYDENLDPFTCAEAWWLPDGAADPVPFGPMSCVQLLVVADTAAYLTIGSETFAFGPADGGLDQLGDAGILPSGFFPGPVIVGDHLVFWDYITAGNLMSQPIPVGTREPLGDFPGVDGGLASDGTRLVVETDAPAGATTTLYEVSVPGGARRTVGVFPASDGLFVTGGGYVYQTSEDQTEIDRIDLETGAIAVAVPPNYGKWNRAVADADYVYVENSGMDVYRVRHCGGPLQLVEHGASVYLLQQDGGYLYWWDGAQKIERLAKPP